ncbi:MAG: aminoacyl-tRNA hydrolase [Oligoflexia bacterium]|nr:aminoacyl-tRNA hydrolase [Oligoflexia bacterium]
MKIVAGLGNPGPKYETTRHNAGFLAIDRLVDDWKATGPSDAFEGEVWQTSVGGEKVLLVKPQTFMNVSGECLGPLLKFYKCKPEDLIVIHDDLDLGPLVLRLKVGGGTGGHNGLKSIDQHLGGNQNYMRVRIGVGHPRSFMPERNVADYVLQNFNDDELRRLDPLLDDVTQAVEMMVRGEATQAQNRFNRN